MKNKIKIVSLFYITFFFISLNNRGDAKEWRNNVINTKLKNGMNVILIINRSSPMIASVVTVNAGSANEKKNINGISHMLEHLLFNGTSRRTQEQLYREQDYYGIYNNAHTSRDYTNYIILAEKDFFTNALDIQSDMLFNSIFPENKFEKEKGIILNELAKDSLSESFWSDDFFHKKLYQGTPYSLSVLGTIPSINQITRKQVIKYYQSYYKPNNMTALIMGNFKTDKMLEVVKKYFGSVAPGGIPEYKKYKYSSEISGKRFVQKIKSNNIYLNIGFEAPIPDENDFYAFDLLTKLIDLHLKTDLKKKGSLKGKLEDIYSSYNFFKGLSSFTITAILSPDSLPETASKEISDFLNKFINYDFNKKEIDGLLTSLEVNEHFLFERPHYYGMMKGQWIATGGWSFTSSYINELSKIKITDLKKMAKSVFLEQELVTTISMPGGKTPDFKKIDPVVVNDEEVLFTKESLTLVNKWNKTQDFEHKSEQTEKTNPQLDLLTADIRKHNKVIMKNGLTVLIKSNTDSQVFALHMLVKNRSLLEPKGKEGIADFIHRLIEKRTATRDEKQLKSALNSIGASLKTKDNPHIPYDNYYNSHEFSYIRFETIDRFFKEAIYNFSDIVLNPHFSEEDIKAVKLEMLRLIKNENEIPSKVSKKILYKELFNKKPFSRRISGNEDSISSISEDDLKNFYKFYFSPSNIIISVATSVKKELVVKEFEKYFNNLFKHDVPILAKETYPLFSKKNSIQVSLKKSQAYIRFGTLFKIDESEEPGLRVLAAILSEKLSQNLRETKGLAYSLGAGFSTHREYGLFEIAVGTKSENLKEVEEDIYKEIKMINKEKISTEQLTRLINTSNSRRLMRSLSRIGQCYKIGLHEFLGESFNHDITLLQKIKQVKANKVLELSSKYLKIEHMVKVVID